MTIKIATRSSKLALLQVDEFLDYQSIKDFEIIKEEKDCILFAMILKQPV